MTRFLLVLNLLVLALGLAVPYVASLKAPTPDEFNAGKIRFWSQPAAGKTGAAPSAPAVTKALCLEIVGLNQNHYLEMLGYLRAAGLNTGQCSYLFDKQPAWWVYWPPEYEEVRRDKVIKAILAAGVEDVLPISQGAMAQAFSLGLFTSEQQAIQFRDRLRGKGLDKVESGPRPSVNAARLACQSPEVALLEGFKAGLPSWAAAAEPRRCWPAGSP